MVRALPARDRFSNVALALVMSGAVGNAIDRLVQGTVTDFIRMYTESPSLKPMLIAQLGTAEWPTYNIADIAIVLGLIMVGVHSLFLEREQTPSAT
jgi:signal peptidase II